MSTAEVYLEIVVYLLCSIVKKTTYIWRNPEDEKDNERRSRSSESEEENSYSDDGNEFVVAM